MNKKLAALLFAIATGASAASAMAATSAGSCMWSCKLQYDSCMQSGAGAEQCDMERVDCYSICGV